MPASPSSSSSQLTQRRLRAGTGVEHRASENLRQAAGDRLVTSHRLKPLPLSLHQAHLQKGAVLEHVAKRSRLLERALGLGFSHGFFNGARSALRPLSGFRAAGSGCSSELIETSTGSVGRKQNRCVCRTDGSRGWMQQRLGERLTLKQARV
ncbi:hypothetical protein INR49_031833 [Caranx melampygus]|nr:hypothetical protein INR49_031833 [Caranx melampygus]